MDFGRLLVCYFPHPIAPKTVEKTFLAIFSSFDRSFTWLIVWFSNSLYCAEYIQQRWSRGHKARGQGQGCKKNPRPRPRTSFSRTDPLEAKERNARGQGQGPRTQLQVLSKKKVFKKKFFRRPPGHRRTQNFFWGGLNHKSHAMTSSKNFKRGSFVEQRYRRMEDLKSLLVGL